MQEATIDSIERDLRTGRVSSRSMVEHYLALIERIDYNGVSLHSVMETNPDALAIAYEIDSAMRKGSWTGPLHGVPILIKDNINTGDRMLTSAGSLAMADAPAPSDAFVVQKLRAAGAVILGKTNMSEWANFRGKHSMSGWSARGGQCLNPYALDRTPCGSSSGSAVAVAANLCVASLGTETDGSIVCPASMTSIVGLKPTLGLVSRAGVVPIAHSQDTVGPLGRTVRDVAILLTVLAGHDPQDPATKLAEGKIGSDYTKFLNPNALNGARLGVARKFFGSNAATDRIIDNCLQAMKAKGAVIVDPADLPSHGQLDETEREVLVHEFKADLNEYLKSRGDSVRVHSLADVIAFNEQHAEEMRYFGQEWMLEANNKGPLSDKAYLDALAKNHRLAREEGIDAVMTAHDLNAIVAPTTGPAWLNDPVNGDSYASGMCSQPAAVAGYPHITVPAGFVAGLPVGISFFGSAWSEPALLGLAYAFEQTTLARRSPLFMRSAVP